MGEELLATSALQRRRRWWAFCLLWLGSTWPYQAVLQVQTYYQAEMPGLGSFVLVTFTWPLLAGHLLQASCRLSS